MAVFRINDRVFDCPLQLTADLIRGKWKIMILIFLRRGGKRYSELSQFLPKATHKMLSEQLRQLEDDGLIRREVHPTVPPRVYYSLTPDGEDLMPILSKMADWGMKYYTEDSSNISSAGAED